MTSRAVLAELSLSCAPTRTTTLPSGGEAKRLQRFRIGRERIHALSKAAQNVLAALDDVRTRRYRYYVSMDLLKNRETPEDGIPRRLPADTVEAAVVAEIRRVLRTPETAAHVIAALDRDDIPEADAIAAIKEFPELWTQLFPAEQARIIQLLVRRVTVTAEGLVIDLRPDCIAGVMRDLMTPRQLEAAQ